jgi:hypothetical protein
LAIVIFLFLFVGTLYKPALWEFVRRGLQKHRWENFVTSLAFVAFSIADIVGAFSAIYLQADYTHAGCFSNMGIDNMNHHLSHLDAIYFTLKTLTTVGYGDIHAASGFCRGWVTSQLCVTLIVIGLGIATLATRIFPALRTEPERTDGPEELAGAADSSDGSGTSGTVAVEPVAAVPGLASAHGTHPPGQQPASQATPSCQPNQEQGPGQQ